MFTNFSEKIFPTWHLLFFSIFSESNVGNSVGRFENDAKVMKNDDFRKVL